MLYKNMFPSGDGALAAESQPPWGGEAANEAGRKTCCSTPQQSHKLCSFCSGINRWHHSRCFPFWGQGTIGGRLDPRP